MDDKINAMREGLKAEILREVTAMETSSSCGGKNNGSNSSTAPTDGSEAVYMTSTVRIRTERIANANKTLKWDLLPLTSLDHHWPKV